MTRPFDATDVDAGGKVALRCIARRDYCSSELRSKLKQHGFEPNVAAKVVQDLEQKGILDERKYIENFMTYQAARGKGPVQIRSRLTSLGFSAEVIERFVPEGRDWVAVAREARRKKFGPVLSTIPAERLRQARFLLQRGFTTTQIRQALTISPDTTAG